MKKKSKKSEDAELDEFLYGLDDDEFDADERGMSCPRCGSDDWGWLTTDKKGKTVGCDQCRQIQNC